MKGERISERSREDGIGETLLIGSMTDFKRRFLPDFYDFNRSSQQCRIQNTDKSISSKLRRTEKLN